MNVRHLHRPQFHGAGFRQPVAVPDPVSTFMPHLQKRHYGRFWAALLGGLGGLIALSVAVVDTRDVHLMDVFVVLGSLFVPTLYVYYLDLRNMFVEPRWRTLVGIFLLGAFLAAPLAFILEIFLPAGTGAPVPAFVTGLIEEFAKAVALFWVLRKSYRFLSYEMDGIILGAAAGMGFAALEDIEYAANAFTGGLHSVVAEVWFRQVMGPFGHGTWTAIVAGTIWRVKGTGRPRITLAVIGAYLLAAGLHGAWDWEPMSGASGLGWLFAVGIIGLLILRSMIHEALAQEKAAVDSGFGQTVPAVETGVTPNPSS